MAHAISTTLSTFGRGIFASPKKSVGAAVRPASYECLVRLPILSPREVVGAESYDCRVRLPILNPRESNKNADIMK